MKKLVYDVKHNCVMKIHSTEKMIPFEYEKSINQILSYFDKIMSSLRLKKRKKDVIMKPETIFPLCCTIMLILFLLSSCTPKLTEGDGALAETSGSEPDYPKYSVSPPAWAAEVNFDSNDSSEKAVTRADGQSTMYVDSYDENFGAVTKITAYAEDNENFPCDIVGYKDAKTLTYWLFLPCTANLSEIKVRTLHENNTETGVYTLDFTEKEYGVNMGQDYFTVEAMQSDIPSLFIEIDESEGSINKMNSDPNHTTFCFGELTLLVTDGLAKERGWKTEYKSKENDYSTPGSIKMRGRGNWTWNQDKKPYQITFEKKTDLLGMGEAKNYLLLANVMDASLLRNQIFYDLADEMGLAFSPDIEPVDVFLNGEYMGSYSLSEKVEVGENRVDIDKDGDFLLELDHYYFNETYTFETNCGYHFTMHNREDEESLKEINKIINKIERSVCSEDSTDYMDCIDVDSWVKYWWIQDLSRNNDTFIGSNFFYYAASEEKLYAGPIWDMDNTLGIWGSGENLMSKGWHSDDRGWLGHLYKNPAFNSALVDYYTNGGLRELFASLPDKIDGYAAYIEKSYRMNYIVNRKQYFVDCGCETFEDDIAYLKNFITDRLDWYDKRLAK